MKNFMNTAAALLAVTVLLVTGCSRATPSPTALTAAEIFQNSGEKFQALSSFHFVLDQIGGGTPVTGGIEMTKAQGDVARPDGLQTTISGTALGMFLEIRLVISGNRTFMTNPLSGKWEALPDQFKILSLFDPGAGVAAIMKDVAQPVRLEDEELGGTLCYRLKGTIVSDSLRPIIGSAATGVSISAEVWIGKEDFLARHIRLEGKITESEKAGIVRTLELSGFNQPVSIKLPE
ncbi:MAG: hypothetical protein A2Z29_09330 [Chloroflexi bacterium RBG_16_56_11]|nr:MAG: hypothetical protein A2Z29_09330 [Chloroflexi bacterium RBG_16_56_11]